MNNQNFKLFLLYFLVVLPSAHSQDTKNIITYEDIAHENLGCPENSACTKDMGLKYKAFKAFMQSLSEEVYISKQMEDYRSQYGLPVRFLALESTHKSENAVLWNSPCRHHNQAKKIYLGLNFYKDNPSKPHMWLDPAIVYTDSGKKSYQLPFKDHPSYIDQEKLVVVKEIEGTYYYMAISEAGLWTVVPKTGQAYSPSFEVTCPEDKDFVLNKELYLSNLCKKVWDITNKKFQIVRLMWACE